MALTDPQSVTIGASTIALPRVNTGNNSSSYKSADSTTELVASSQYGRRTRRTIRINSNKLAADPLITTQNVRLSGSVYLVFDFPDVGFTATEQSDIYKGLAGTLSASSYAVLAKLLGGES
jgi:hypothetical protein